MYLQLSNHGDLLAIWIKYLWFLMPLSMGRKVGSLPGSVTLPHL